MEWIAIAIAVIAIGIAWFKKGEMVIRYESQIDPITEKRIKTLESIIENYELKLKK